jgi:hypothetical protein
VWAVADAWGKVQVSKGDAKLYDTNKEAPIAEVAQEATYARATNDPSRDVVLVADEKEGEVTAITQSGSESAVADVDNAYGVAYNNAWGWSGEIVNEPTQKPACDNDPKLCATLSQVTQTTTGQVDTVMNAGVGNEMTVAVIVVALFGIIGVQV